MLAVTTEDVPGCRVRLMQVNAVVMMRFDSAKIGQLMSEIVAYGTAVVLNKAD